MIFRIHNMLAVGLLLVFTQVNAQCFDDCLKRITESKSPFANLDVLSQLIGCPTPDVELKTIDNQSFQLSELKDKIVVLNFWFVGCAPCRAEMPILNALVDTYGGKKVVFIAINSIDSEEIVTKAKLDFQYKIVVDKKLASTFCVIPYPSHIIIDSSGRVAASFFGPLTDKDHYALMTNTLSQLTK